MVKKTIQKKKKVETKKKVKTKGKDQIKFIGQVTKIRQKEPATVIEWPRSLTHFHTYGLLSPFFEGLRKGELRATVCPNKNCPENRLWIPPRAHCPDCHTEMTWKALPNPVIGKIYTPCALPYGPASQRRRCRSAPVLRQPASRRSRRASKARQHNPP